MTIQREGGPLMEILSQGTRRTAWKQWNLEQTRDGPTTQFLVHPLILDFLASRTKTINLCFSILLWQPNSACSVLQQQNITDSDIYLIETYSSRLCKVGSPGCSASCCTAPWRKGKQTDVYHVKGGSQAQPFLTNPLMTALFN